MSNKTFALADLHGQLGLWKQIKQYLDKDDKVYFLGDAIDRGPNGYALMKELLSDSRVIYIKGNHESMMQEAITEIHHKYDDEWIGEKFSLWTFNGGYSTIEAWANAGSMYGVVSVLRELPLKATYINTNGQEIYLSHAGFTPGREPSWEQDLLWGREHLTQSVSKEYLDKHVIVVHGHTPTPYLIHKFHKLNKSAKFFQSISNNVRSWDYREENGAVFYCNETKIDIDCAAYATGQTILLDLDSFITIPFTAPIEE